MKNMNKYEQAHKIAKKFIETENFKYYRALWAFAIKHEVEVSEGEDCFLIGDDVYYFNF